MAPIGTCRNHADGRDWIISYNGCCGKSACGRCFCDRNEGDRLVFYPSLSNDGAAEARELLKKGRPYEAVERLRALTDAHLRPIRTRPDRDKIVRGAAGEGSLAGRLPRGDSGLPVWSLRRPGGQHVAVCRVGGAAPDHFVSEGHPRLERIVSEAVRNLFTDSAELARCARDAGVAQGSIPELLANADRWRGEPLEVIDRVDLGTENIVILVDLGDLLPGEARISLAVPMAIRRRGVESRLVIEDDRGGSGTSGLDPVLVKAIARGLQWFEDLVSGRVASLVEIAKAEGVTESYVGRLLPLAFLAPDIVESVLAGTQPVHVTTEMLTIRADLPIDWKEQESLLGFERAPAS